MGGGTDGFEGTHMGVPFPNIFAGGAGAPRGFSQNLEPDPPLLTSF